MYFLKLNLYPSTLFEYFLTDKELLYSMNKATIKANPTATRLSTKVIDFVASSNENYSVLNGFV